MTDRWHMFVDANIDDDGEWVSYADHVAEVARASDIRCVEAARLGYCSGHDDTVEGRYSDPSEVARDIVDELEAAMLIGKSARMDI